MAHDALYDIKKQQKVHGYKPYIGSGTKIKPYPFGNPRASALINTKTNRIDK